MQRFFVEAISSRVGEEPTVADQSEGSVVGSLGLHGYFILRELCSGMLLCIVFSFVASIERRDISTS